MRLGSLFDGIGGALLCAVNNGIEPVWASEIEPFPIMVTAFHFPQVKHLGDITKINGAEIEPVDIIVGGSPCQDLSVAGKRAGLAGARSGLFMEQIRIIKEMRLKFGADKPRFMVWENVPGAFSSNSGEDFRAVLEETARVADGAVSIPRSQGWSNAGSVLGDGFSISWRTLDAQYWGVPQRRRRIYLVADFGGQSAPKILFERESVSGNPAESQSEGQGAAEDAERCVGSAVTYGLVSKGNGESFLMEEKHMSLSCGSGQAGQGYPAIVERRTDDAICYGISSTNSNSMKSSNPTAGIYKADTARTIDLNGGNPACNQGGIAVCYDMTHAADVIRDAGNRTPTLQNRMGTGGNQVPLVMAHGQANAEITEDQSPTLNCNHEQPILANCLKAKANLSFREDSDTIIRQRKQVRRLTPLECERLQGYPDNYTNIPGASDSARYKALGNSFAIPCADFVIKRCREVFT